MKKQYKERLVKFYNENREALLKEFSGKPSEEARRAISELVAELVNEEIKDFDLVNFLFETDTGNLEDKHYLKDLAGVNVYWVATGGDVLTQKFSGSIFEIPKATVAGRVRYSTQELKAGFVSTVENMVSELTKELKVQIQKYAADLYTTACAGTYTLSATAATLEAVLDTALNAVYENTEKSTVYILGRRNTLTQVSKLGASEVTKEERDKYGIIARFHDAELKPVPLVGRNKTALLPENRLFVVAADCGKFITYGDAEPDELKVDHFTYDAMVVQTVGAVLVPTFGRAYVINIS